MKTGSSLFWSGAAKGAHGMMLVGSVALFVQSFFVREISQRKVLRIITFLCNPTSPFCNQFDKVLTSLFIILVGGVAAYRFAKGRDERVGFVASFSLLFWIFQFLIVLALVLIIDVIVPIFRITPLF